MWLVYRAYTRRLRESEGAAPKALSAAEKRKLKKLLHDG
jgi:hypothetical protein